MKKLLIIIFTYFSLIGNVYAEIETLESQSFNRHKHGIASAGGYSEIHKVCIDGYMFVAYSDWTSGHGNDGGNSNSVSIVQFNEDKNGKSLPKKC